MVDRTRGASRLALPSVLWTASALVACGPSNAQKPGTTHAKAAVPSRTRTPSAVSSPAPTAATSARPVTTGASSATSLSLSASGYIGKRGIVGTLGVEGARWRVAFHFIDGGPELVRDATATVIPPDAAWEDERTRYGLKVHPYLACTFDDGGAPASASAGSINDAQCLHEQQPGERGQAEILEVAGAWSTGAQLEPFYLRTAGGDAIENQEYLATLLGTPTPPHDCIPFVELLSADERPASTTLAYTLRWRCDPEEEREPGVTSRSTAGAPPPPSHEAYVADVGTDAPHPLLWASKWTTLPDPDELNVVHLGFSALPLTPELFLYVGHVSDEFQSPNTGSGNSSERIALWAADAHERHGSQLELVSRESGRAGWCMTWNKTNSAGLLDLNGDKLPELVVERDEVGYQDAASPNGERDCIESPATRATFFAYRLNTKNLAWTRVPTPRGFSQQMFDRATPLP
jgi:hypothetical protein